jgi:hypothetical protein
MVDMEVGMDEVDGGVRVVVIDIFRNVSGWGFSILCGHFMVTMWIG